MDRFKQNGFVVLISVLIVAAIGTTLAVALLLLGVGALRTSFTLGLSAQARALADGCAERALQSLRLDISYSGSESFMLGNGVCTILPVGGSGNAGRVIQAIGQSANVVRKVEVVIGQVRPKVVIASWDEVADF